MRGSTAFAWWDCGFESRWGHVLSGRGLCDGPIPRPEEFYDCGVSLCVIEKPQDYGGPSPRCGVAPKRRNMLNSHLQISECVFTL